MNIYVPLEGNGYYFVYYLIELGINEGISSSLLIWKKLSFDLSLFLNLIWVHRCMLYTFVMFLVKKHTSCEQFVFVFFKYLGYGDLHRPPHMDYKSLGTHTCVSWITKVS